MPLARRTVAAAAVPLVVAGGLFLAACDRGRTGTGETSGAAADSATARLQIAYPQEGTLFPPEIVAPTFTWEDKTTGVDRWNVVVHDDGAEVLRETVDAQRWRPS